MQKLPSPSHLGNVSEILKTVKHTFIGHEIGLFYFKCFKPGKYFIPLGRSLLKSEKEM